MLQANENLIFAIVSVSILVAFLAGILIFAIVQYYNRRKIHLLELNKLTSQFENELLQTKLEIQESVFNNISQEIHDNVGQVLSLVKLKLSNIEIGNNPKKIEESKALVGKAIHDLRNLAKRINSDHIANQSIRSLIEQELINIENSIKKLETECIIVNRPIELNPQTRLFVYRIFQESVNNIIKHANASMIKVKLEFKESYFVLTIQDNGVGFLNSNMEHQNKGIGLINMRNRANMIDANLSISSTVNLGVIIKLSCKYESEFKN